MTENPPKNFDDRKVSVIIPFYNRAEFLAEAIESVLAQTHRNWELILVDDGSLDDSFAVAERFVENYPQRIFLHQHEGGQNRGASSSRNRGIEYAVGDFVTFLDSDDVFLPTTLEIELKTFAENEEADAVCGTLQFWFSWRGQTDEKERDFAVNLGLQSNKLYEPPNLLAHNLRAGGRKPGIGCVIIRGAFARKVKLFEDDFRYVCEDQIFWARLSLRARIFIVDACLAKYRQHERSSSSVLIESGRAADDWQKFLDWLEKYLRENKITNEDLWSAFKLCRRENGYKAKYRFALDLYRRIFPYHLRYRIRDLIVGWRTRGKNY